jgi:predicted ATP-grasp superfamily ATP-dependent carboligase
MQSTDHLLIFGASARAAAFSALRAGLRPWCADLFADADLRGRCPAMRLPGRYPLAFLDLVKTDIPGPWMYTGGLEAHPLLIRKMEKQRPLWGNGLHELSLIRDPEVLAAEARAAGLPSPAVAPAVRGRPPKRPESSRWLVKPVCGSGGARMFFWNERTRIRRRDFYLQQYIEGVPAAALYCGAKDGCVLLGVSRQLVGEDWLHAPPFRYCGSIGPLSIRAELRRALGRLGKGLAFAARGLFGVDGILAEDSFWPVEVNPRYTASVEVLEFATGLRAVKHHWRAFADGVEAALVGPTAGVVGKAILYARRNGVFPADGPWRETIDSPASVEEMPAFADIPHAGDAIRAGRPVLTLLCRAATMEACQDELRAKADEVERRLYA